MTTQFALAPLWFGLLHCAFANVPSTLLLLGICACHNVGQALLSFYAFFALRAGFPFWERCRSTYFGCDFSIAPRLEKKRPS